MAKKLQYNSYNLVSGLSQGKEEQTFRRVELTKIKNLRYHKSDSLISIEKFTDLGLARRRR